MKLLAQKDPSLALPTEKVRYLGGGKVEIRLVVDEGCQKRLESLLHLLAHKNPQPLLRRAIVYSFPRGHPKA